MIRQIRARYAPWWCDTVVIGSMHNVVQMGESNDIQSSMLDKIISEIGSTVCIFILQNFLHRNISLVVKYLPSKQMSGVRFSDIAMLLYLFTCLTHLCSFTSQRSVAYPGVQIGPPP
jgi:hypothetical protein